MTIPNSILSVNHFTTRWFQQTCTTKEMKGIAKETEGWIFRHGEKCVMRTKKFAPGMYHVFFVREYRDE